jgi:hypothetical protein
MKDKSCQDADSLWKDVIEDFFEDFMKFFTYIRNSNICRKQQEL